MVIEGKEVLRGLIVEQPHAGRIQQGIKPWEMRKSSTKIRGTVAIIEKGTWRVLCLVDVVDCLLPIPPANLADHIDKHCIDYSVFPNASKWCVPWVLENVVPVEGVTIERKQGPVIWVKL